MKPYIICHMLISIDGRIKAQNWPSFKNTNLYEKTGNTENADAWMCGRTTMQEHYATVLPALAPVTKPVSKTDFINVTNAPRYVIVLDPSGKLGWESNFIDGEHIVVIIAKRAADEYLAYLQEKGVSYIFGGERSIDLAATMLRLNEYFGIKRILLEGGGHINGSFHAAGLIDEYSLLIYPLVDGSDEPTLLETNPNDKQAMLYQPLQLTHHELMEGGVMWLKYKVVK